MAYQSVFQRRELKFLLTREQKAQILLRMTPYMEPDRFPVSSIRNLYFDTDSFLLIRRSIEKPVYKEKLRIRSYGPAETGKPVFVELKKKYRGVVYKRRISLPEEAAMAWLCGKSSCPVQGQIPSEIDYTLHYYQTLHPTAYLSYHREAYTAKDSSGLRVTFDDSILCRQESLSLCTDTYGHPILPDSSVLMEVKCAGGMPLWLAEALSGSRIYKTSFSKYGTAYQTLIYPNISEASHYA